MKTLIVILCSIFLFTGICLGQSYQYNILPLVQGAVDQYATSINNYGNISGFIRVEDGAGYPVLWTSTTQIILTEKWSSAPGARKINNKNQILFNTDTIHKIYNYPSGVVMSSPLSGIYALNDKGEYAGWISNYQTGYSDLAIYRGGIITNIGRPQGASTILPWDMNLSCQIVGRTNSGPTKAFLWDPYNGFQNLPNLGGQSSSAYGINDAGWVVGSAQLPGVGLAEHAFLWRKDQGIVDLGVLSATETINKSVAWKINGSGLIVGQSYLNGWVQPVYWDKDLQIHLLPMPSNCISGYANGINAQGQMVGSVFEYITPTELKIYAVRWDPVPEPTTLLTLGVGLFGFFKLRKK